MRIRRAEVSDIDGIMELIAQAQAFLKTSGVDQWQDGFPGRDVILSDIENSVSHVFLRDERMAGFAVVSFAPERYFDTLTGGEWINSRDYGTIHRTAAADFARGCGLGTAMFELCESECRQRGVRSVRVDTHEDNAVMRSLIAKRGFTYCGLVFLNSGAKRLAYEKLL